MRGMLAWYMEMVMGYFLCKVLEGLVCDDSALQLFLILIKV